MNTTLSLVIPVYNEEKRIAKTFAALMRGFRFPGIKLEKIIFADDGSTDKTRFRIQKAKGELEKALQTKVQIVSYQQNRGKGYAVKQGMQVSGSDYTLFFDADMSTPLSEFKKFLPFIKKAEPVIIGTRKNGESTVTIHQPRLRELLGKGFTLLSNIILNTWVTDFTCGFKCFSRKAKDEIFSRAIIDRWGYDAELMFLAKKLKYPITEKAVIWANDPGTKVDLVKALPQTLQELLKIRTAHFSFKPQFLLTRTFSKSL